jgi:hypothetical protein
MSGDIMKVWKKKVSLTNELVIELSKNGITIREHSVTTKRDISLESFDLSTFAKDIETQNKLEAIIDKKNVQLLVIEVLKVFDLKREPADHTTVLFSEWDIFYACESGNTELVKQAVQSGVNVNATDPAGNNALFYAVGAFEGYSGFVYGADMQKVVKVLMKLGVKPNVKNYNGETILDRVWSQVNTQTEINHAKAFEMDIKSH